MYQKALIMGAVMTALLAGPVMAETAAETAAPAATPAAVPPDLADKLKPSFGGKGPDALKPTPVPGLFEASFGGEILYVSSDGRYVFVGDLFDSQTRSSLTEEARSAGRKTLMASIDPAKTIEFKAKGDEKHVIYAFTDVDCPFCVKLHKEVPAMNDKGITVRYLAYPRAGVDSPSYKKMVNAWCADNKQEALTKLKNGETLPDKECTNPVADDYELGQKLGVDGTPAILTNDGIMISGFRPADQMLKILDIASKSKAKAS